MSTFREGMYSLSRTIDVKGYSNLLIAPYQGEKVSFTGSIKLQLKHLRSVSDAAVYKYIYGFSPLLFEEMGCSLPEEL